MASLSSSTIFISVASSKFSNSDRLSSSNKEVLYPRVAGTLDTASFCAAGTRLTCCLPCTGAVLLQPAKITEPIAITKGSLQNRIVVFLKFMTITTQSNK